MVEKINLLPEYNPEPVLLSDKFGNIIYKNNAAYTIFPDTKNLCDISDVCKNLTDKFTFEIQASNNRYYKFIGNFIRDDELYLVYVFDITELKEKQKKLEFLANYDELTGLPNKNKLVEDMITNIDKKSIIILIDIKSMRQINSLYGYDVGDHFLKCFSKFLSNSLEDSFKAYRLYGNIFAIYDSVGVHCQIDDDYYLLKIFYQLNTKVITVNNIDIEVEIRMGIASCQDLEVKDENYPLIQLKFAETALLEAKKNNYNVLHYHKISDIDKKYKENRFWINIFKKLQADSDCEIIPYFQPIINNSSQTIEKYEALMRIKINNKIYTPNHFIDIANESGEITQLTRIMVDKVFKVVKDKDIEVSINLTPQDVNLGITQYLKEKIINYKINPEKINLELLENEDFYELENEILNLKDIGFKISLDDFGAGFSNFSKLISMDIDYLKIDGSIIKNIHTNNHNYHVVKNIHEIGKTIHCKTIAEYVANVDIFEKIVDIGIDYSQGYFFYKPSQEIIF